ncbi:AP-3 complex subunit beta [Cyberlindnera fabianii]|uniref:AP-3 complex subunit beta n=1 Tax=Cyberlindnera fabianii TaxID=36022 RepID=A0A1V2L540_CYBFA|nr:AP-3 complex subunit beta [Cyberlindnera fabianii]
MADPLNRITAMLESARDMTIEAAAAASAKLADTPTEMRPQQVSALLNAKSEREVLRGLKYVISLVSSGKDASGFFTDVVKNVSSSSLSVRKLVYTYLLRYAEKENDTALLSVNAIQKSLGDKNEQVRALAIRVMSEIRIGSIYPIVLLGIRKCIADSSVSVRKASAVALINVYNNYGASSVEELIEILQTLLKDRSPVVIGETITAFKTICPDRYDLLHGHYRRLCSLIPELNEWSQAYLTEILTNYAREFLPRPKIINTASSSREFITLPDNYNEIPFPVYDVEFDPDLKLFLDSIKGLVYNSNEAVILAVGRAHFHLSPPKTFKESQIAAAFVRNLITSPPESANFIIQSILFMAMHDPTLFVQYEKRFYLLPRDHFNNAQFKLKILSAICNENNIKTILHELQYYALNSEDKQIAIESVKAIGVCSQISDYWSGKILKWLLNDISDPQRDPLVVAEFLTVIRYIVQQNPQNNVRTVARLARLLDQESLADTAKESIIWLVGEFASVAPEIGPDVLRKLIKNFAYETDKVRYHVLLLSAKIYSHSLGKYAEETGDVSLENYDYSGIIPKMFNYVTHLARYDDVYDTRDRARTFYFLLSTKGQHTQLATLLLQAPKPVPLVTMRKITDPLDRAKGTDHFTSLQVDEIVKDYNMLPPWCDADRIPDSSIREEIEVKERRDNDEDFMSKGTDHVVKPVHNTINHFDHQVAFLVIEAFFKK